MSIAVDHVKAVIYGTRDGGEEWTSQFAIGFDADVFPSQAGIQDVADDVYTAFATAWTTLKGFADASTKFVGVRAYFYPAGQATPDFTADHSAAAVVGTASAANNHPYQVAIVCSLRSQSPSRSGRGRMYLPLSAIPMTVQGQYSSAHPGSIGSTMKTFFDAVNAGAILAGASYVVSVASQSTASLKTVTSIVTDSVPDIQRRRANKLTPSTVDIRNLA